MKFYVTTPIYYVNSTPHIGHAYTTIAADIAARWQRLRGYDAFFLTGTDEHGAKIAEAAAKAGEPPREFCDRLSGEFRKAWETLRITPTRFIRTTEPQHENGVRIFLDRLFKSGAIYRGRYEGLYCVACEKFYAPEDLTEDGCCPDHKQKPVQHAEENYFFRLSRHRDALIEILSNENHPQHLAIFPLERRNEIVGKLKKSLEDISISRAAVEWGVPLPFDPKQTVYVWIDALLNYITGAGYESDEDQFKRLWPADIHLMAKDILWFHSVIWPAMLLEAGLPLPRRVFAHGFFTVNGEKMSKTLGNVIHPDELVAKFGTDASRYLLLSLIPYGTDGDLSWQSMIEKYNTDLANNLGNLVARTCTMVEKYFGGTIPEYAGASAFTVLPELSSVAGHYESLEFHRITEQLRKAVDAANRYIEETAPWKMAKENHPDLPGVFCNLLRSIGTIVLHLVPFMPSACQTIWEQIGETGSVEAAAVAFFKEGRADFPHPGRVITKGQILFPRIQTK